MLATRPLAASAALGPTANVLSHERALALRPRALPPTWCGLKLNLHQFGINANAAAYGIEPGQAALDETSWPWR